MKLDMEERIKKEQQRNERLFAKVQAFLKAGVEDEEGIKRANAILDLLSRWQSVYACFELCRLGLWGRVVHLLPLLQYPDIEPTAKNITDFLTIEMNSISDKLNGYELSD